ncbi:MAG: hypothetical protein HY866_01610, partial [Chloroflexi bacterium]|nr:hypothetical protein [Chloroflexota bacterium]
MIDDGWDFEQPQEAYAQLIITVIERAPLLAIPRLARIAVEVLADSRRYTPGILWGGVVLPEAIRLVIGPAHDDRLIDFVDQFKAQTEKRLLAAILRADDDSLDMVLRYTPVWGGVIYRVWEAGCHRSIFWTEYKLSNAV